MPAFPFKVIDVDATEAPAQSSKKEEPKQGRGGWGWLGLFVVSVGAGVTTSVILDKMRARRAAPAAPESDPYGFE